MSDASIHFNYVLFEGVRSTLNLPLLRDYLEETDQLGLIEEILPAYGRMYSATWEVKNNKLYLTEADCRIILDDIYVDIVDLLFPVSKGSKPVNWFNGKLTFDTQSFTVSCISSLATKRVELGFNQGQVISIWRMERDLLPGDIRAIEARKAWCGEV